MNCPFCSSPENKVVDSRSSEEGNRIRRRRECLSCGKRFTTYEAIEFDPLVIIKKDGTREAYDRNKILNSMLKACEKRTVPLSVLEEITDEIEHTLQNEPVREITSAKVGELVMEQLMKVDEVAYVRFASVYRQFKDIDTFMDELTRLLAERQF